jgi:type I restriction enzyme, S subunit
MTAVLRAEEPSARYLVEIEPTLASGFELLATARGGVPRLREMILLLAVQGKLVAQEKGDEPANQALNRVWSAKSRLIADGKIKQDKTAPTIADDEVPFEIPDGWAWARLSQLTSILNGRAYSKQELLDAGTPVLRVGNLFTSKHWYYSNLALDEDKYCAAGDLLFAWSASFGPFIWPGPKVIYHYHIWKLSLHSERDLDKNYLYTFLLEKTQEIKASGHGVSMIHMTKEAMEKIVVPVPPLAEQHRIVARVEELMKLCDALEQSGRLADEQHARLTSTLFDALAASESAQALAENWQRVAEHFDLLLDRPEAIDALEQRITQLAVAGKLVGRIQGDGEWQQGTLGDVVDLLNGYAFKSEWFRSTGVRLVRNVNVAHGSLVWSYAARVEQNVTDELSRFALSIGDIVLSLDRPIISTGLKYAVIQQHDLPCLLLQRVARMKPQASVLAREYLELWLNSPEFIGRIDPGRSNGVPHISTRQLQAIPIALPPLAEQHRIVARVEELRCLCAQLRERLTDARRTQTHLAEALVAEVAA